MAKLTEAGSYLQTGQAVVSLISDDQLELEADVPYDRLEGLTTGKQVSLTLDNGSDHIALVRAVIPEENPRTRTRKVRFSISWQQSTGSLASQQSATIQIPAGVSKQVLTVHKDALIRRGGGEFVYVVNEGKAEFRPVATGQATGNRLEVLDGLSNQEQVVIRGNERLQPDQAVQVAESN